MRAVCMKRSLPSPEEAVSEIKSGTALSFGMAAGQPPALLGAIASRIRSGDLGDLRIYYKLAMKHAAETVLADDVLHAVHPCPLFMTEVDRHIAEQQRHYGKKILSYVPCLFLSSSEAPHGIHSHRHFRYYGLAHGQCGLFQPRHQQ